jgi:phosphoglycolate phosphatase-like HAD superfamily hydrolase
VRALNKGDVWRDRTAGVARFAPLSGHHESGQNELAKAILLDVDGTLVNSNEAHARAWVDVGRESGLDIRYDTVRSMIGMGSDKVIPKITPWAHESPRGKEIGARHGEVYRERYLPHVRPFHGTHQLLEFLDGLGFRLVIATSAAQEDLDAMLRHAKLERLIDDHTTSGDVDASKPDPDIVHAALNKAGAKADEAIFLGDTPYDIEAARRAGVRCIALRCGGWWTDDDLRGAIGIHDDPAALREEWRY